jgi:hypothetical protein
MIIIDTIDMIASISAWQKTWPFGIW